MALSDSFERPQAEHSACPFWFWNGDLKPDELLRQIHLMHEKGIRAFMIHARKGLTIKYLSEEWFERVRLTLEEAAKLGMKVWLYDEDNWPSGYAGGRVLARDPNYAGQNLILERHYVQGPAPFRLALERSEEVRAVLAARIAEVRPIPPDPLRFHKEGETPAAWSDRAHYAHIYAHEEPIALEMRDGVVARDVPEGYWCLMVARQQRTDWFAAYSDTYYIDLMNAAATQAFLEETHEQYWRRFKKHFGKTILGFFVDEPGFYNNFWDRNVGSITWTHDFAQEFEKRRGYSLLPWLPALWEDLGARSEAVRCDYWRTVAELTRERFFQALADWCSAHGVMLTGHLNTEEWLFTNVRGAGNPFTSLQPLHVPACDKIDEVWEKITEKLAVSVAHANGRQRALSETFALIGWKLAPPYMKRIVDYQFVRGINWLCCHAFFYSIEDFRARECPPSEFFQNPWWQHSKPLWDYVSRLSAVLSQGIHVAPVALYYPVEQAWATMTPEAPHAFDGRAWEPWQMQERHLPVQVTDYTMIQLAQRLLENQCDFDFVDQSVLGKASVAEGTLRVGAEAFQAVVVPPVDVIAAQSLGRFLELAESGGTVLFVGKLPERVAFGQAPAGWPALREKLRAFQLPEFISWRDGRIGYAPQGTEAAVAALWKVIKPDITVCIPPAEDRILFSDTYKGMTRDTRIYPLRHVLKYHHRRVGKEEVYFLVNESDQTFPALLKLRGGPVVEEWIPQTGERRSIGQHLQVEDQTLIELSFAPWQSHLLVLRKGQPEEKAAEKIKQQRWLNRWRWVVGGYGWRGLLTSWHELGLARYSGTGTYYTTFQQRRVLRPEERLILNLGVVLETAEVQVNGVSFGPLAWPPYEVDITQAVREGKNEVVVVVANTLANEMEGQERPSGLLGPVELRTVVKEE